MKCEICRKEKTILCEDCGKYFCKDHNGRMHGDKPCEDNIKGCHGTLK